MGRSWLAVAALGAAPAAACVTEPEEPAGEECAHPEEPVDCEGKARPESGVFDEEVCVPGGWFLMGTDDLPESNLGPQHWVELSPFFIDRYPVTIERYQSCVEVGACAEPPLGDGRPADWPPAGMDPRVPVEWMTRDLAESFCAWDLRDGDPARLPTEAEFQRAVVGLGCAPRPFPWGREEPDCDRVCNFYDSKTGDDPQPCAGGCVVDVLPQGESPDGVAGLTGSVVHPTRDCYRTDYYGSAEASGSDPVCDATSEIEACRTCPGDLRVWGGTSRFMATWMHDPVLGGLDLSALSRVGRAPEDEGYGTLGVRCVRTAR